MQTKRMFAHDYTRVGFYMIRGFKSGVTAELRKRLHAPGMTVWEDGYHDRVIMSSETLRAERRYIHDNPRRHCLRKAHPDLFVRVNHLVSARLPAGTDWTGFGNLFLLEKPELVPVQVSRNATPQELSVMKAAVAEKTAAGAVMMSPFLSPGEKEIAGLVMAQEQGSLILLKPDGFPPLYKPSGMYFDLCAHGRLLVLSPFVYTGHREALSRERCLRMNGWVRKLCREPEGGDGKNAAAR